MFLSVLGGLAIFGVSEVAGEVYHDWHHNDEKNKIMVATRKITDCTEVVEEKVSTTKANIQAKINLKKASKLETIEEVKTASSINDVLDNMITNINVNKNAEVMGVLSQAAADLGKACDVIIESDLFEKLNKTDSKSITDAKQRTVDIINKISAGELSEAQAKDQIKKLADKIAAVATKVDEMERSLSNEQAPVTPAANAEIPKIPNFVKEDAKPATKLSDIKKEAESKSAGTKNNGTKASSQKNGTKNGTKSSNNQRKSTK